MKIIVTGAGGFLGQELIRQLALDETVSIFALTSQIEKLEKQYIDNQSITVCSPDILFENNKLFTKSDILVNCAFPRKTSGEELEEGLEYIKSVLESTVRLNVGAVINISSQSVYDPRRTKPADEKNPLNFDSLYALGKYTVELLVRVICKDIMFTNIRLSSLIGPNFDQRVTNKLVDKALETGCLSIKDGKQYFGFLDVKDAAGGIIKLIQKDPVEWKTIYNLGSQNSYSLIEIANTISAVMEKCYEKKIEIKIVSDNSEINTTVDSSLIMLDTDYSPQITLEQSILNIIQAKLKRNMVC